MAIGRKGGNQRSPGAQFRAPQHEARIVELRLQGQTYEQIAAVLNMSVSGVSDAYQRAMRAIPAKAAQEARVEQLQRLDALRRQGWVTVRSKRASVGALEFLLRVEQREAALLGTDSATKLDLSAVAAPDNDAMVRAIQENLTVDEQRQMLHLMRKARGLTNGTGQHAATVEISTAPSARTAEAPMGEAADSDAGPPPPHYHTLRE